MEQLSATNFERARSFLARAGRAVDRALFRLHFEGGSARDVVAALAPYQNEDGGFGHAIEPDFQLPASSAMATSVAFILLREADATSNEEMVARGVAYLAADWDPALPGWRGTPLSVNDYPHAPWWSLPPESVGRPIDPAAWGNPNAELVGVLNEHASRIDPELVESATRETLLRLDATPTPVTPYVALSFLRFAAAAPPTAADRVIERLRADAPGTLEFDRERLAEDHFSPYWLGPEPDAPLADLFRDAIAWDLDRQIDRQDEDGAWPPAWSWGPDYPKAWREARELWRSEQTLRTLRALAAYGRIEGL